MPSLPRVTVFSLAAALFSTATAGAEPPREAPAPETIVERFTISKGGVLLVPVELKGKKYLFALDTGCSSGVYDSSLAPLLGEPISKQEVRTADGVIHVPLYQSPDAKLGGMSLKTGSPVVTTDFRRLRDAHGEEIYGCVGMDFLTRHVFRIDPDRGEVVFLKSPGADPGERLPTTIENNIPFVRVKMSGLAEAQTFMVDTGCSSGGGTGLLKSETYDLLAKQNKIKPIDTVLAASLSGQSVRRRGRVAEIELAGHRHSDLIFSASGRNLLGLNYWSRYVTTFDFAGGAIYLKKSSRFDQADTHDLSGLSFVMVSGRVTVVDVEAGSPAAKAGIKTQDVLLKANGDKIEGMPLLTLRRALAVKGAKVSLIIERSGKEWQASFVLPE